MCPATNESVQKSITSKMIMRFSIEFSWVLRNRGDPRESDRLWKLPARSSVKRCLIETYTATQNVQLVVFQKRFFKQRVAVKVNDILQSFEYQCIFPSLDTLQSSSQEDVTVLSQVDSHIFGRSLTIKHHEVRKLNVDSIVDTWKK